MPKHTFINLPENKREDIIDISLDEFAKYEYKLASLSRIVEKAGIAKGSMYQYFENKKDLYLYLIDFAAKKKLSYLNAHVNLDTKNFFELYKELLFISSKFNLEHPKYGRILYHGARENYSKELGNVAFQLRNKSKEFVAELLTSSIQQNQIRSNINIDIVAFFISQISIDLEDYIENKFSFSYDQILEEGYDKLPVSDYELENIVNELIEFIKIGMLP